MRLAPNVAYDNPGTAADGLRTNDDFGMYNGATDRYEWKLVGKREMYIPDNGYKANDNKLNAADIPVVQLSLDRTLSAVDHYELGARLGALRDEGVLVIGSGNVVHNLHAAVWGDQAVEPYDWAVRFEEIVRKAVIAEDHLPLIDYRSVGSDARLSAPTPDHYLPLMYVLGVARKGERISFPTAGIQNGAVSMLSIQFG